MHVVFLAPETHVYNHEFVRGLVEVGARVSGVGHAPQWRLAPRLRRLLSDYVPVRNLLDTSQVREAAAALRRQGSIDRIETIDEPIVLPAAQLREALDVPGLSVETATLCRDKSAMKDFLRKESVPCAASTACASRSEAHEFAERTGYPLVVKPRAGFGALRTFRVENRQELESALEQMRVATAPAGAGTIAIEEFVEGHEGFYDTLTVDGRIEHDFISHYYPGCLEAMLDRNVSPRIAHTNRVQATGYDELRLLGERVHRLLGLDRTATHMEWFFGESGLKFSEIGARPAGERIWDLYRVANDADIYREWALAVTGQSLEVKLKRKYATGSIQIRPDRDGVFVGHRGIDEIRRRFGDALYEQSVPEPGTRTLPLEKGWLVNTWFRLRHPDYDTVREMMEVVAGTVRSFAR